MSECVDVSNTAFDDMETYIMNPVEKQARRMEHPFSVLTNHGVMMGEAGDYLIIGLKEERYPCMADVFEKTYKKK